MHFRRSIYPGGQCCQRGRLPLCTQLGKPDSPAGRQFARHGMLPSDYLWQEHGDGQGRYIHEVGPCFYPCGYWTPTRSGIGIVGNWGVRDGTPIQRLMVTPEGPGASWGRGLPIFGHWSATKAQVRNRTRRGRQYRPHPGGTTHGAGGGKTVGRKGPL